MRPANDNPASLPPFASFRRRAVASLIDTVIMSFGASCLGLGVGIALGALEVSPVGYGEPVMLVAIALGAVYVVLLHAARWQGTIGKRLMRIRAITEDGQDLDIRRSALRYMGSMVSMLPMGAGYAVALFRPDKATLHDLMFKTRVVVDRPLEKTQSSVSRRPATISALRSSARR